MKERDIFWCKEVIENGDVDFYEVVGASDNPIMFRYEDDYIVQADECLYMNDSLEITKIDTDKAVKEIESICKHYLKSGDDVVSLDGNISLEASMYIDCLLIDGMLDEIDCEDYVIDCEHNFVRKI